MPNHTTLYQVDAFTETLFGGNPAAVCPLDAWLPNALMQAVAAENNLAETAFFVPRGDGDFDLRWFTPVIEADLCGHATLASGFIVMTLLDPDRDTVRFHTASGPLMVGRDGERFTLDLPGQPPRQLDGSAAAAVADAAGVRPLEVWRATKIMAVLEDEAAVRATAPNFDKVARLDGDGLIITAPADMDGVDFVSRYFAPHAGIPEDPVTGSAHSTLVPYWAVRLGRSELSARQVSKRGGALRCRLEGERVMLAGSCALYLSGTISLE
jgi:PhzF family phenazine biosynthesis protein